MAGNRRRERPRRRGVGNPTLFLLKRDSRSPEWRVNNQQAPQTRAVDRQGEVVMSPAGSWQSTGADAAPTLTPGVHAGGRCTVVTGGKTWLSTNSRKGTLCVPPLPQLHSTLTSGRQQQRARGLPWKTENPGNFINSYIINF